MKFFRTVPKTEQQRTFYADYARFDVGIKWLILVSQVVSSLTESVIFYQLGYDTFAFFGRTVALFSGLVFALLGVAIIEVFGLRFMLVQCANQYLFKRFTGAHLAMTIFITIVTVSLITASVFLSLDGGTFTVKSQVSKLESKEANAIQLNHDESLAKSRAVFHSDSMELVQRYVTLLNSTTKKYDAELTAAQSELRTWTSKQGNYKTRINKALTRIDEIKANSASEIA
ncbi:MAG: hypothetical protein AAF738_00980 [Bacteroidota bacterium]